ncbi:MAG TPA: GNAT family N-acetyltransferase [Pyrinomonadaceae bacterium]|nr:GNAT family N-acetyltransferase [Pyrinomonadaceae bacterium]
MSEKKPPAVTDGASTVDSLSIETARLRLRMFRPEDLDDLAGLFADPNVVRYVGDGKPVDREETDRALTSIIQHWRRHGFGRWAVEDKRTHEFVGFGGLRSLFGLPEVVYHFATAHWGKGFATELGRASLRYGFEAHRFARIVAIAKPENAASIHVMEKLGLRFEMLANYYGIDVVQYSITREDFRPDDSVYIVRS